MKSRSLQSVVLATCIVSCSTQASLAALYAYNGYAILNSGPGNTYYDIDQQTANPDFVNNNFVITFGQSLKLGGQVTSDAGSGQPAANGPDWGKLLYQIDNGGFTAVDLPYLTDYGTSGWKVTFEQGGSGMAEIGSALSVGSHSLTLYFQTHDNTQPWDAYLSNGGANYSASITVDAVPEPADVAAAIFGGIAVVVSFITHWTRKTEAVEQR